MACIHIIYSEAIVFHLVVYEKISHGATVGRLDLENISRDPKPELFPINGVERKCSFTSLRRTGSEFTNTSSTATEIEQSSNDKGSAN